MAPNPSITIYGIYWKAIRKRLDFDLDFELSNSNKASPAQGEFGSVPSFILKRGQAVFAYTNLAAIVSNSRISIMHQESEPDLELMHKTDQPKGEDR
jgi:hypothetical protein